MVLRAVKYSENCANDARVTRINTVNLIKGREHCISTCKQCKHEPGVHEMDTCVICNRKRSAELKFSRIKDGWICIDCLRESALSKDYPDFAQRNRVMKSITASEMKKRIDRNKIRLAEAEKQKKEEALAAAARKAITDKKWENRDSFPVTTIDISEPYDVIGPVFFQTSNKGLFSSSYSRLAKEYREELDRRRADGTFSPTFADWGFLFGTGWSVGQNDFDPAFYIAIEELKRRAIALDADALIGLRVDFDLDTNGFQYFYLQSYGTAVKFKS